MKFVSLAGTFFFTAALTAPAFAQSVSVDLANNLNEDDRTAFVDRYCAGEGSMANSIMVIRQSRKPMAEMIADSVDQAASGEIDPETHAWIRSTIISAYDISAYDTDEVKQRVIADFSNDATVACYRRFQQ